MDDASLPVEKTASAIPQAELDALTQRSAREVLAAEGIELVTFKALRTAS